jgi:hypothetical protein
MIAQDGSTWERIELALAAARTCIRRTETLLSQADPQDGPLQKLLQSLAKKAAQRLTDLERHARTLPGPGSTRWTGKELRDLLRKRFPSVSRPLGEAWINRESGMFLAECLEEECAAFYRDLAAGTTDPATQRLFEDLAKQEQSILEYVRRVLL